MKNKHLRFINLLSVEIRQTLILEIHKVKRVYLKISSDADFSNETTVTLECI